MVPQAPQFWTSVISFAQLVPHAVSPLGHWHIPCWQLRPVPQAVPQVPQFAASVCRSTQAVPQAFLPAEHAHAPFVQLEPVGHAVPHAPQWLALVLVSTHVPEQLLWPFVQPLEPAAPAVAAPPELAPPELADAPPLPTPAVCACPPVPAVIIAFEPPLLDEAPPVTEEAPPVPLAMPPLDGPGMCGSSTVPVQDASTLTATAATAALRRAIDMRTQCSLSTLCRHRDSVYSSAVDSKEFDLTIL
jgi:hypothetical protein